MAPIIDPRLILGYIFKRNAAKKAVGKINHLREVATEAEAMRNRQVPWYFFASHEGNN
jgi:hypothetical protein